MALAGTSSTVVNRSAESGLACPVPDLGGKAFSFSPLTMSGGGCHPWPLLRFLLGEVL